MALIDGTAGNDVLPDTTADDTITGYEGNDNIFTTYGFDEIYGDDASTNVGDDTITVDWSDATHDAIVDANHSPAFIDVAGTGNWHDNDRGFWHYTEEHFDATTGSGDDTLIGHIDNADTLDGGAGTDLWGDRFDNMTLPGGSGLGVDMALVSTAAGQTLEDGSHLSNLEVTNLILSGFDDVFRDFGAYDDTVRGAAGNDDIGTSQGRDSLDGSEGDDTLTIDWSDATQNALVDGNHSYSFVDTDGSGNYFNSTRSVSQIRFEHLDATAGSGNDTLIGNRSHADTLDGGAGADRWDDWFDVYSSATAAVSIDMAQVSSAAGQILSDGTTVSNLEFANLSLSEYDDSFRDHGDYGDTVFGQAGDDDLGTSQGRDSLDGGSGDDTLTVDWSDATQDARVLGNSYLGMVDTDGSGLLANSTRAFYHASFEHMNVTTGSGNDLLEGVTDSADTLNGGLGDDTLRGNGGADLLIGGGGNDYVAAGVLGDTVMGGAGNDFIVGDAGNDSLVGDAGKDRILGGAGNDTIEGGVGRDRLIGDAGNDWISGGNDRDTLLGMTGDDTINAGDGDDVVRAGDDHDLAYGGTGNDLVIGGTGRDTLYGNSQNDTLRGNGGFDTVDGGAGDDHVYGGAQADLVLGGHGNDTLSGGGGFDTIDGGLGNDELTGNFNADQFLFTDGHGRDTITDFEATNDHERIDLSGISAITGLADLNLASATSGAATQVGADVVIDTGGGSSVTLLNVSLGDLDANDFTF